jgi:hypothetical protein
MNGCEATHSSGRCPHPLHADAHASVNMFVCSSNIRYNDRAEAAQEQRENYLLDPLLLVVLLVHHHCVPS